MTLKEIAAIASFQIAQGVLELCTSLLVTIIDDEVNQTIKLAHFSVKEYLILTTQLETSLWYRFKNEQAQAVISEMAVTYLLDPEELIQSGKKVIPQSLLEYSAQFWPEHAVKAFNSGDPNITLGLQAQIDLLFNSNHSPRYIAWLEIYDPDEGRYYNKRQKISYPQPLYYASMLGLEMTVKNLLKKGCRILMEEGSYGNACNAAAICGNFKTIECLGKYHKNIISIANLYWIAEFIRKNAKKVFTLFLEAGMVITKGVMIAAAKNWESGKEVMMLLLEKQGADVVITEEVVTLVAKKFDKEVMMLLLEKRGADVVITEEVVKAAAGNDGSGKKIMMLLFEKRGADVVITEEVVKAAAGNPWSGKEVMMLLLEKRGADVVITEEVVKAAAENWESGKEVMMLLLEKRGADVVITEEVVKAAAGNWKSGKEVMMLLLEKRGADIVITEEVVTLVAKKFDKEVMILLLEKRGADMVITEEVVTLVAKKFDKEVMILLLEKRGADVVITEEVVKSSRELEEWKRGDDAFT
jgi:dephospho-CoA kinase